MGASRERPKMKVSALSRSEVAFTRERGQDVMKVFRNTAAELHPLEKAREYQRALNAVKLDRVMAKPFVGALEGHTDGVWCMARSPTSVSTALSGSCDGEVKVWDLGLRRSVFSIAAHTGFVRGLAVTCDGRGFATCGDDGMVKMWRMGQGEGLGTAGMRDAVGSRFRDGGLSDVPQASFLGTRGAFRGLDTHWKDPRRLVTVAGEHAQVWDTERSDPLREWTWGCESINTVRFNPAEADVFLTAGSDRSVVLYDLRSASPTRKLYMQTKTNAFAWNPYEPFNFVCASEDGNCYSYDMRNLEKGALCVHKDHVGAVMAVDFSPTGREFVTGSYDCTVRIFPYNGGRSREVYHTNRMQKVFSVRFSGDAHFVLSGSDDSNVRIWKSKRAAPAKIANHRQAQSLAYSEKLRVKFKDYPEIARIERFRRVPKALKKATEVARTKTDSFRRREQNRRNHSHERDNPKVMPERKRKHLAIEE